MEEHGRGIRGVFAKDESNFQKLLRQGVQSDAVLSHVRLQPAKTIPALFPGPQGHLRVMKSSQLLLRGAGGTTPTNLRARWRWRPIPRRPETCTRCKSDAQGTRGNPSLRQPDIDQAARGGGRGQIHTRCRTAAGWAPASCFWASWDGPPDLSHFTLGRSPKDGLQPAASVSSAVLLKPLPPPSVPEILEEGTPSPTPRPEPCKPHILPWQNYFKDWH